MNTSPANKAFIQCQFNQSHKGKLVTFFAQITGNPIKPKAKI